MRDRNKLSIEYLLFEHFFLDLLFSMRMKKECAKLYGFSFLGRLNEHDIVGASAALLPSIDTYNVKREEKDKTIGTNLVRQRVYEIKA